eukprot:scaffold1953_cov176-Amphora_coffeaeformis.AAC.47
MARARYQLEQLRTRPQEIYDLRNKEEKQRFAKVSQNTHDSKRHPGKVTKGIAHKDGCLSRKIHRISQNEEQKCESKALHKTPLSSAGNARGTRTGGKPIVLQQSQSDPDK